MLQPEGFAEIGKENLVCRLNKSLYGLKQAPRCWYKRFDSFIISLGYNRLSSDHCTYYKRFKEDDVFHHSVVVRGWHVGNRPQQRSSPRIEGTIG